MTFKQRLYMDVQPRPRRRRRHPPPRTNRRRPAVFDLHPTAGRDPAALGDRLDAVNDRFNTQIERHEIQT